MGRLAAALLALAACLSGGEKPRVRHVFTRSGVVVTLESGKEKEDRARGFLVRAVDADEKSKYAGFRAFCALPEEVPGFRMGFVPLLRAEAPRLRGFRVVTWTGKPDLKQILERKIDGDAPVTLEPVWKKGRILAFEIAARPAAPPERTGSIERTGKPSPPPAKKRVVLTLPKELPAGRCCAVVLAPRWKEEGRSLAGYDVSLVSMPREESGGRSPR